jgi:signal transduction histidine kinase
MSRLKLSFIIKLIAGILFAVFLTAALLSTLGIAVLLDNDMFFHEEISFFDSELCKSETNSYAYRIYYSFERYLFASSAAKPHILEEIIHTYSYDNCNVSFTIQDSDGKILLSNYEETDYGFKNDYIYEKFSHDNYDYYINGSNYEVKSESYIVTCSVRKNITAYDELYQAKAVFDIVTSIDSSLFVVIVFLGGILCLLLFVFLMCAAGHCKSFEGISLNRMDKIPFDIYTAVAVGTLMFGVAIFDHNMSMDVDFLLLTVPITFICSLTFIVYSMSFAVRYKTRTLLKNTVTYNVCKFILKLIKILINGLLTIFRNMSVIYKVLLGFGGITVVEFFIFIITAYTEGSVGAFLLWIIEKSILCALLCLLTLHLIKLRDGGERIASGDTSYKIDTSKMLWDFKKHGENLNNISEGISIAVEERLKSERMKTELITNVSHDIKTPLTSIINYIDLLKKEDIGNDTAKEYLAVLDRQSARLKKMTEDLVEASKASSGSINVSPARTDIKELLSQAVGEYDERLRACSLEPVITVPENEMPVYCDGRLLWRVFDNLLSNICKYSQPSTRVYFTAFEKDSKIEITFRNISKYPLNISSEELTERFVRGDSSRSTEGSGLGLSIAKSLTELQKGRFELFIDGDLFKVIITFDKMA